MKKIYNAPEILIIMDDIEPLMTTASPGTTGGGNGGDDYDPDLPIESKGGNFFEDFDDWDGWN